MDNLREFEACASDALGVPVTVRSDGVMHRFPTNGKAGDTSGWAIFHGDHGAFGDWRTDFKGSWVEQTGRWQDPAPLQKQGTQDPRLQRHTEEREKWVAASERAERIWRQGASVPTNDEPGGHPYLRHKMVEPHGLRQIEDTLLVPMIDSGRNLWSLQFISADGRKLFMRGGRTKYVFHVIEGASDEIGVAEGYATGAAVYKLTGATVYCAFNAGNLERVTMLARAQHEGASLTVWGDDDRQTPGNPGRTKAELAAKQANAKACFPDFSRFDPHNHPNPTDFNDYLLMEEGAWA